MIKKVLFIIALVLPITVALAQENENKVQEKNDLQMESRMFQLKYKDPNEVAKAIAPMSSGKVAARLIANSNLKTLTIRDLPENLKVLSAAIDKLDVPEPAPATFELQTFLIAASEVEKYVPKVPMPKELDPVINSLRSTLKYKSYRYITTALNRVNDFGTSEFSGTLDLGENGQQTIPTNFNLRLQNLRLRTDSNGKEIVSIERFSYGLRVPYSLGPGQTAFSDLGGSTSLNITPGGMTVVGTTDLSTVGGALIVVISAKRVN